MTEIDDRSSWLPVIRETFAGIIAIVFATTFLVLVFRGYQHSDNEKAFGAIKELITIVNGIVGVIVGYYFSRMSTEARAEKAEKTAIKATDTAGKATEAAGKATETAGKATEAAANASQRERETTGHLTRLTDTVKEVLPTDPGGAKGAVALSQPDPAAVARLREAVRQAERALGR